MGGGNPISNLVKAATDVVIKPVSGVLRGAGLGGVSDVLDQSGGLIKNGADEVSGANASAREESAQRGLAAESADRANQENEANKQRSLAAAGVENERMAAGSGKSRTLLTGSAGLTEDETISKKTLLGRR